MILDKIIEKKRVRLKNDMERITIEGWKRRLKRPGLHKVLDFYGALKDNPSMSIIGEIKKASPSKGIIKKDFEAEKIAKEYIDSKVQAISILTEKDFFKGDEDFLWSVRQLCPLPILRKDFIIELWQVYQSRCLGADAILLITSLLDDEKLKKFQVVAGILGMHCLVEVHDKFELERALKSGAKIIGINNRDLTNFSVDIKNTENLISDIPHDRAVISESGIRSREDITYLKGLGVDAVLIGETFMRAESIGEKIGELRAV